MPSIQPARLIHRLCVSSACGVGILISGCQISPTVNTPPARQTTIEPPVAVIVAPVVTPAKTVTPAPELGDAPLTSQRLPSTAPNTRPIIVPLPQPAPRSGVRRDGHNIPAFNSLLTIAREQIGQAKWADAEQTLTRAQRMAPDSPTVYAYFAEIALKNQQWNRADAMARRGLLLTQNPQQQRTFWQIVLLSAQQQNNARGLQEAQQKLAQLR